MQIIEARKKGQESSGQLATLCIQEATDPHRQLAGAQDKTDDWQGSRMSGRDLGCMWAGILVFGEDKCREGLKQQRGFRERQGSMRRFEL